MSEWYNNILGTGTNIFGAGANSNTDKLVELGLLSPDAKSKAQSQSLMQGLIGTGVNYLAQPKNQDYGSFAPYLGKALQSGMAQAQKPFDNLSKDTVQNLQLEKYQAEIGKLNAEAKAEANTTGLGVSKLNPKDFTPQSWAKYVATGGDTRVLDALTPEVQSKINESNAKLKHEYGIESNTPTQQTQGNNGLQQPVKAEEGFRVGNNNIPNHPSNVTLGTTGDVVTPTMYKLNLPEKTRLQLQNEAPKVLGQHRANIDAIREQRNLVREFLNNDGANEVTGVFNRMDWNDMPGSDVSNAKAQLYTITQKEFLNNYKAVKATGGGFGALSEREGERLESMGFNLDDMQSEEAIIAQLKKMDESLRRTEERLEENYLMDYGKMDGGNMLPLIDYAQPKTRELGNTGIMIPNKQADEDLLNKYR
tara:strand:- start:608 stop:1870 length:1263 start_codon:yes stop_codon:yes gene_type:complete